MLATFNITQRGESHVVSGTECQDSSASIVVKLKCKKQLTISAVADGVGSCQYSKYGSETAVKTVIGYIKKRLERVYSQGDADVSTLIRNSFEMALKRIHACADSMKMPVVLYDTTLTVVVYDGNQAWYGHVGDSGCVALLKNGTYALITKRHKGEEANSVFPLPCKSMWEFGKIDDVVSFVLMTDGVLDFCVGNEKLDNRVFFPFLKPVLTEAIKSRKTLQFVKQDWSDFFAGNTNDENSFRSFVGDDISFVVVQNVLAVTSLDPIVFDLEAWNRRTQEFLAEQHKVLDKNYEDWKRDNKTLPKVTVSDTVAKRSGKGTQTAVSADKRKYDRARWGHELNSLILRGHRRSPIPDEKAKRCIGWFFKREYTIGNIIYTTNDSWYYEVSDGEKKYLMKQLRSPFSLLIDVFLGEEDELLDPARADILDIVYNFTTGVYGFLYPRDAVHD